jgi:hypothetical protein
MNTWASKPVLVVTCTLCLQHPGDERHHCRDRVDLGRLARHDMLHSPEELAFAYLRIGMHLRQGLGEDGEAFLYLSCFVRINQEG